jgi:hypothetical protein
MGGHLSNDSERAEHVSAMGQVLGERFHDLSNELLYNHLIWNDYRALNADPTSISLLNATAPVFFWSLEHVMWESVIISICRLTDKTEISGKSTLSLRRLPLLIDDESLKQEANRLVEDAVNRTEFARTWRNRRLAHTELVG